MSEDQKDSCEDIENVWDRSSEEDWDHVLTFDQGIRDEAPCLLTPQPVDMSLKTYSPFQVITMSPGSSRTFYASGPPGASVNLSSSRRGNTGGHQHAGGPTLDINPSSFTLGGSYPQNKPWTVSSPAAAGICDFVGRFNPGNPSTHRHQFIVKVEGLARLPERGSIVLTGSTSTHPDNHYGTPDFVGKIEKLADAFKAKFDKPIYVNDMSLEHGGLFDFKGNWNSPHAMHREGKNADINSRSMSSGEKAYFKSTASALGLSAVEHGNPLHWHVSG